MSCSGPASVQHITYIIHPKSVQCFGYPNFGRCIKESVGELFPFPESRFDDLKPRDITIIRTCELVSNLRVLQCTSGNLRLAHKGFWSLDVDFAWFECLCSHRGLGILVWSSLLKSISLTAISATRHAICAISMRAIRHAILYRWTHYYWLI